MGTAPFFVRGPVPFGDPSELPGWDRKPKFSKFPATLFSTAARFGLARWDGIPRVFGPGMFRIAALQFLFHLLVPAGPEPLQVLSNLNRLRGRGKEMEKDLYPSVGHFGCICETKHFLYLDGENREIPGSVIERHPMAARYDDKCWHALIEKLLLFPRKLSPQSRQDIKDGKLLPRADSLEPGEEPFFRFR